MADNYQNYQNYPTQQQQQQQQPPSHSNYESRSYYNNYDQGPGYNQGYPPNSSYQPHQQPYQSYPSQFDQSSVLPPGQQQGPYEGQERGLMDHVPFTAQHAQHEAQKHQHPLAALLNKEGTKIALNLVDAGDDTDQLIPQTQSDASFKPAYTVNYNLHKYDGQVLGSAPPKFDPDDQAIVGSWNAHTFRSEKLKFEFPWGKWGFDPQDQNWLSDVKLLGGEHEMNWVMTDESGDRGSYNKGGKPHVKFTLRCVDVSDSEKRLVSKVVVKGYSSATIEMPVQIVANKKQLDELVVVSVAVMDWYRDQILAGFE